ncbi:MAG: helix-turn-helix transcriptional regulator [Henriciella sp.]
MVNRKRINAAVSARIRLAREQAKYSQAKLASELSRSVEKIALLEAGGHAADAGLLYELSKLLDVPITWFFENSPQRPQAANDDLELERAFTDCADMLAELRGQEALLGVREAMRTALASRV